jgi:hypothetical protein
MSHFAAWRRDTDSLLELEFAKDETYYNDGTNRQWSPFLLWQEQLKQLLPALPKITTLQQQLGRDETMVLLYEANQQLFAFIVGQQEVKRVLLCEAGWSELVKTFGDQLNNNVEIARAVKFGDNGHVWEAQALWHENVCNALIAALPTTKQMFLVAGTFSNLPWIWALKKQGCPPVRLVVSVQTYLSQQTHSSTKSTLVQGHIEKQPLDPDFTAIRHLWTDNQTPISSITETLLDLKDSSQLHYFGHGQTAEQADGNYLSMTSHKLFTRLLPITDVNANVINLSACYSAQSQNHIGLANVLLASGANHVIGCIWRAEAVSLYCFNKLLKDISARDGRLTQVEFEQAQQALRELTYQQVRAWITEADSQQLKTNANYFQILKPKEDQKVFGHPYFWANYIWLSRGR